eukprot:s6449_g2.t1
MAVSRLGSLTGSQEESFERDFGMLMLFHVPQDENEHGAASMCAGGNGEDCACHGGASFADHSCDSDFGGDGHAALAAALLSETRDTDQVSIFTGVAAGAADGRLDCSSKWAAWFEDDCCDFDLEVPEPSMLRYHGVAGNRTREPERNQQDPQRAKTDVDNGPLPQERLHPPKAKAKANARLEPKAKAPPSKGQGKGKRKVGAKGKGTGQEPPQGRPKGGATSDANRQGDDGGWVTVARKVKPQEAFTLRAKDWTAPILKAGELAAQLDALPDGKTLQGVVLASTDDVFVSLKSVLRGCPKPHQVLLLRPSREPGSQRVPGQVGERLAFRNFEIANVNSENASGNAPKFQGTDGAPVKVRVTDSVVLAFRNFEIANVNSENASGNAPKFQGTDGAPVKVRVTDSVVLYMRVSKLFCEPKLWTAFEKAAAKEALQWVASRHVQALDSDSFAWTREKARSGDSEQFFGLVRVAKENVGPLLSSSGQQGVFVSAPRNVPETAAAACEVVWVDRAPQVFRHWMELSQWA